MSQQLTYAEMKRLSEKQLHHDASQVVDESTPPNISNAVKLFSTQLGGDPVVEVPVVRDQYGLYGWCSDGVREKIKHDGGSILFGWSIWEWPKVLLTGEFHAIWISPDGNNLDITPKPQGEATILFVPDRSYLADFDFEKRPGNRRYRLYRAADPSDDISRKIKSMKTSQREYETRRALKVGLTLEQWFLGKQPIDPMPSLIDEFIEVCANQETKLDALPGYGLIAPDREFIEKTRRRLFLLARIKSEIRKIK